MRLRQSLFWDTDPKKIDLKKHAKYVIERILDFGNDSEVRWMTKKYSPRLIKNVTNKSRVLHNKTKSLWKLILQ